MSASPSRIGSGPDTRARSGGGAGRVAGSGGSSSAEAERVAGSGTPESGAATSGGAGAGGGRQVGGRPKRAVCEPAEGGFSVGGIGSKGDAPASRSISSGTTAS